MRHNLYNPQTMTGELVADILKAIDRTNETKYELVSQLSNIDKRISEIYHEMEITEYTSEEKIQMFDMIQEAVRLRREIKFEIDHMKSISSLFEDTRIAPRLKGVYNQIEDHNAGNMEYATWKQEVAATTGEDK